MKLNKKFFLLIIFLALLGMNSVNAVFPEINWTTLRPSGNATGQALSVNLNVVVYDNESDEINVTFMNESNSSICATVTTANNTKAECEWTGLSYNTTYSWHFNASAQSEQTNSGFHNFTTTNSKGEISVNIDKEILSLTDLRDVAIELVDVGLDTAIHVLTKYPGIAILMFIIASFFILLALTGNLMESLSRFFKLIASIISLK